MGQEVELRYIVPSKVLFRDLAALTGLGAYTLQPLDTVRIRDEYLDTDSRALASEGWACRIRKQEDGRYLTLKGPADPHSVAVSRPEWEIPLGKRCKGAACWSQGPLSKQIARLTRGASLAPVLIIRQRRQRFAVLCEDRVVAELCLDRVRAEQDGRKWAARMLECELCEQGRPEDLCQLHNLLSEAYALVPERTSKLELAVGSLRDRAPTEGAEMPTSPDDAPSAPATASDAKPTPGVLAEDTMPQAAAKVIAFHLAALLANEPGTRLGKDPEALHDMRVASRRLRSALRLFGFYLHSPHLAPATDGLRRLARMLGPVRDLDVALDKASAYASNLPDDQAADMQALLAVWREQRERARGAMLAFLDGENYRQLLDDMYNLLEDLGAVSPTKRDLTIASLGPLYIQLYWRMVRAYDAVLQGAPIELLHALRIDCKRLRYALEFLREGLPRRLAKLIPRIVTLQDHLGDLHDAIITAQLIEEQQRLSPELAALAGLNAYRKANLAQAKRLRKSFPAAWQRFLPQARRAIARAFPRD